VFSKERVFFLSAQHTACAHLPNCVYLPTKTYHHYPAGMAQFGGHSTQMN
jgi:hypothetical protein